MHSSYIPTVQLTLATFFLVAPHIMASSPSERIVIVDSLEVKLSVPFGIVTFDPATCSWDELSLDNIAELSGKSCDNPGQSYVSSSDWRAGNAFYAYCNNNNEIRIK